MQGLFQLSAPADMLKKLRHDFERLKGDHVDAYAAFDFFVTARHIPEWLYPGDKTKQDAVFSQSVLMRVCRHIADGSKHFEATAKQHDSVADTRLEGGAFQAGAFQSDAFDVGNLIVHLTGDAASCLGNSIEVVDLAQQVLTFWEAHQDLAPTAAPT